MSREISIWIDNRWYDALSRHLKNETLEEHLENVIDEMCNRLPRQEYERISALIWQEQQQARQEREAARRFAVFHVTEDGNSIYFLVEEELELLHAANRLRDYIRKPDGSPPVQFTGMFSRGEKISREQFEAFAAERLDNTGRVTGAFDVDLDKGTFEALHIMDGWQRFRIQDVSTAAYFAMKKTFENWDVRWKVFLDRLDGKQLTRDDGPAYLTGKSALRAEDVSFAGDIVQNGSLLEFYMEAVFDADRVFGTHVCTTDNDDYVNVYANYDMDTGHVCDTLEVYLVRGDGGEQDYKYHLSDAEREMLRPRMEEYCCQQTGMTLGEWRELYHAEQAEAEQAAQGMEPRM